MLISTSLHEFSRLLDSILQSAVETGVKDEQFDQLALNLFQLQWRSNPVYRKYCDHIGAPPGEVNHWREIPALPVSAFKDFEVSCLPEVERKTVFYSSGTGSDRRSRHYHGIESSRLYELSLLKWFQRHLLPETGKVSKLQASPNARMRILSLTPSPASAPHSSLAHMCQTVIGHFGDDQSGFTGRINHEGDWHLDLTETIRFLTAAENTRCPIVLLATAFSLVHLLDEMEEQQLEFLLADGSRLMETGGYKGRSRELSKRDLDQLIHDRLDLPESAIVSEYGMSELNSQAYDHVAGEESSVERFFSFPPWAKIQVISPESGKEVGNGSRGLLRIVDLANVWSVSSIQTEDVVTRDGSSFGQVSRALDAPRRGCSLNSAELND